MTSAIDFEVAIGGDQTTQAKPPGPVAWIDSSPSDRSDHNVCMGRPDLFLPALRAACRTVE